MAARFDAGQLRHKLILQQPEHTSDDDGGFATAWTDIATVWAVVTPLRGDIVRRGGADEVDISHRIIIRNHPAIKPNMRLRKGARIFTVRTVNDLDETGRYTSVMTQEAEA